MTAAERIEYRNLIKSFYNVTPPVQYVNKNYTPEHSNIIEFMLEFDNVAIMDCSDNVTAIIRKSGDGQGNS